MPSMLRRTGSVACRVGEFASLPGSVSAFHFASVGRFWYDRVGGGPLTEAIDGRPSLDGIAGVGGHMT
ncbi:hypothetical protein [Planctomycetes bacterium CA13]|uniref:hypothetical protein n=1 Tax=Novipirellula herctigrandis TaxID=2527986 RepID=UPI0011B3BF28